MKDFKNFEPDIPINEIQLPPRFANQVFFDNVDMIEILKISLSTLNRHRKNGYFPGSFKLGGKHFYTKDCVINLPNFLNKKQTA
ncbi:MAG: hypothetical protein KGZ81_01125 [Flavobacteriales bacterium]|nr:hypothetical protein [Flavobacteriales bacterium]